MTATTSMKTEIESEHGIVYLASTFEYRPAIKIKAGDVVMLDEDGTVDFDRVIAVEFGDDDGQGPYVRLWFEGSQATRVCAPFDSIMLAV